MSDTKDYLTVERVAYVCVAIGFSTALVAGSPGASMQDIGFLGGLGLWITGLWLAWAVK